MEGFLSQSWIQAQHLQTNHDLKKGKRNQEDDDDAIPKKKKNRFGVPNAGALWLSAGSGTRLRLT